MSTCMLYALIGYIFGLMLGAFFISWLMNHSVKKQLGLAHTPESVKEALRKEIEDEHAMEYPE